MVSCIQIILINKKEYIMNNFDTLDKEIINKIYKQIGQNVKEARELKCIPTKPSNTYWASMCRHNLYG